MLDENTVDIANSKIPNDTLPRFSISALAHSLYYNCKKQIYLLSSPKNAKLDTDFKVTDSLFERGNDFEKELCIRQATFIEDHTDSKDFKQVLQDALPGKYIYQLRFHLPESFYTDILHTNTYRMNSFIPDFLYIHKDPVTGKRKVRIIDAKSSKQMTKSHQFQVTSYAFFLTYLIQDMKDLEIDDIGGVWLPSNKDQPVQFRTGLVMNTVKHIYSHTLPDILSDANPDWKLEKKCTGCHFYSQCKTDAQGTLKAMPYLTNEDDIEDLGQLLENLKLTDTLSDIEHYVQAVQSRQPRFLRHASVLVASETDHSIYLYLQLDLYTMKPFLYGIDVLSAQNDVVFQSSRAVPYDQLRDDQDVSSEFAARFVHDLQHVLNDMDQHGSRCLFYVYEKYEKNAVHDFLYHLVNSDGVDLVTLSDVEREQVVGYAAKCLVTLFQDTQLLNLSPMIQIPKLDKVASVGRFVSIEQLLAENVALGISGHYQLKHAVRWMADGDEASIELSTDKIYHQWRNKSDVEQLVVRRLTWLQKLMQKFWALVSEFPKDAYFPLACAPFQWPELHDLKSPLIAKLTLFKQLECFKACDEVRRDRIRDLRSVERPNGLVLHLDSVESTAISPFVWKLMFTAEPSDALLQQKIDSLAINTMRQYILVPDTKEGIIETIKYSDILDMDILHSRKKLGIKCVDVVSVHGSHIVLHGVRITMKIRRWRLYRRYIDSTTVSCINNLQEFDTSPEWKDTEHLITDPNGWATEHVTDEIGYNTSPLPKEILEEFNMSPSQQQIVENLSKSRLQIVWGPPGSGKTEFLALFVNWYIKCYLLEERDKELIIGVTAFTREAIMHLLKRVEKVQKEHGLEDKFSIIYVAPEGYNKFSEDSNIATKSYDKVLAFKNNLVKTGMKVFVIGSTVWHWIKVLKSRKRFLGCDMMILDESTQLLVSDAVLAIHCLHRPSGKLIIAGDHMQLGPIIKNDYTKIATTSNEPLLYGSIQQCLMRTIENQTIYTRGFLLQESAVHDLGPNTWQLHDNWRMNGQLNAFFQKVYGPNYTSRRPDLLLQVDWNLLEKTFDRLDLIQSILDPEKPISLVKLQSDRADFDAVQSEASVVQKILEVYVHARVDKNDELSVMIITPHHVQRVALQRRVDELRLDTKIRISTVEKLQGQECDLVFACFSCLQHTRSAEFVRDFRRWNVALSRAKRKVIILSIDKLMNPDPTEGMFDSFHRNRSLEPADGYALIYLLQQWAKNTNSLWEWQI